MSTEANYPNEQNSAVQETREVKETELRWRAHTLCLAPADSCGNLGPSIAFFYLFFWRSQKPKFGYSVSCFENGAANSYFKNTVDHGRTYLCGGLSLLAPSMALLHKLMRHCHVGPPGIV